jgi:serine protease Do
MSIRVLVLLLFSLLVVDPAGAQVQRQAPVSREAIRQSFAPIVKRVAPAVVNVTSRKAVTAERDPFLDDPFFNFFFRDRRAPPPSQRQVQQSLGSGVIVGSEGLIVTNHHVVAGADEIDVVLSDRRSFRAKLVASDERSDLAFLRIDDGGRLPAIQLADSDAIEVGDLVLAVGNPFGIGQTVTSGIISATARTAPQLDSEVSFLQTDAAVNPGNSGGALVDVDGRLIGINTAIFSRSGGSIGIGFAIPSNLVRARMAGLDRAKGGEVTRPWLGAELRTVDREIAGSLGLERPAGVLISRVYPAAAAARAGLAPGDVVMSIDGVPVDDAAALAYRLALRDIGDRADLVVLRKGRRIAAQLPVEAAKEQPASDVTRLGRGSALSGATVANLSPAFSQTLGIDMFDQGVVVVEVVPGSRAQAWRLRPGDVVEAVDGRAVADAKALERAARGDVQRLEVRRERRRFTVAMGG